MPTKSTKKRAKPAKGSKEEAPIDVVHWIDHVPAPVRVGVCLSEVAWAKALKRIGTDDDAPFMDGAPARCTQFAHPGAPTVIFLSFDIADARRREIEPRHLVGVIVHECMHAWRWTLDAMGEARPGLEIEAYAMQDMVQDVTTIIDTHGVKLFHEPPTERAASGR